jgi:hypothetical protein
VIVPSQSEAAGHAAVSLTATLQRQPMMHISQTTHEHARSAKVYSYEADFECDSSGIRWTAKVRRGDEAARALNGSIPFSSPAKGLAEQAVRDAIVTEIDALDEPA